MLNVGLTGNVASGKSRVAQWFREWGATVIDADAIAHELEQAGTPVFQRIVKAFGDVVVAPDGALDRAELRRRVTAHPTARETLEGIVHPAVRAERDRRAMQARARGERILVNDIPLLFETLDPTAFDMIVLVDAPPEVRRQRLMRERGFTAAEADALMATQLPAAAKRDRSDIVIDNRGSLAELEAAARTAWRRILARASTAGDRG